MRESKNQEHTRAEEPPVSSGESPSSENSHGPRGTSRRTVLKAGAAVGAASLLPRDAFAQVEPTGGGGFPVAEPQMCLEEPLNSPPHTPFVDRLPKIGRAH